MRCQDWQPQVFGRQLMEAGRMTKEDHEAKIWIQTFSIMCLCILKLFLQGISMRYFIASIALISAATLWAGDADAGSCGRHQQYYYYSVAPATPAPVGQAITPAPGRRVYSSTYGPAPVVEGTAVPIYAPAPIRRVGNGGIVEQMERSRRSIKGLR